MVHPNTKIKSLIAEFRHEFGDMSGSNVPLDALLLYHFLKTMSGTSGSGSGTVNSTVTVRGSTGATILTNAQGALLIGSPLATETTLSSLSAKLPPLTNNRLPVDVQFPSSQSVNVSNQISGFSTESTLSSLLNRIPQPITGRLPVNVQFPATLATETTLSALNNKLPALVGDRLPVDVIFPPQQGFSTEDTLLELVSRTPELIQGKTPIVFDPQSIFRTEITNPQTGLATEQTLSSLLGRFPNQVNNRIPVGVQFPDNQNVTILNQLTGISTEATLSALVGRIPESINNRLPVNVLFPTNQNVTVSNQLTEFSTESTLSSLLSRIPEPVSGRIPVGVQFPTNQAVTVSNPVTGYSTEATLSSLLSRIPSPINDRLPVAVSFPSDLAKDASTVANGQKLDQIITNTALTSIPKTLAQHYTSKAGGQRTFNATAGIVSIGSTATLATLFFNPIGSGVDIYIMKVVLASLAAGNFMRYRGGSYTIGTTATLAKSLNRSKGTLTPVGKLYGNSNVSASGGDLGLVNFNAAHGIYPDDINGTIILPPGDFVYWMFASSANQATQTAIEVAWWELPAV